MTTRSAHLERVIAIERKSLPDLLGCIGQQRERFDREVQRLLAYPCRALVVESTWPEVEAGEWRSKVTSQAAVGSLLGWVEMGLPVVMAGDHERAGRYVARLLFTCARRRWAGTKIVWRGGNQRQGSGGMSTVTAYDRLTEFVSRLENVTRTANGYEARCPAPRGQSRKPIREQGRR